MIELKYPSENKWRFNYEGVIVSIGANVWASSSFIYTYA